MARVHHHVRGQFAGQPVANFVAGIRRFLLCQFRDIGDEGALVAVDLIQLRLIGIGPAVDDRLIEGRPVVLHMMPLHRHGSPEMIVFSNLHPIDPPEKPPGGKIGARGAGSEPVLHRARAR